jgi:hypothetical protein
MAVCRYGPMVSDVSTVIAIASPSLLHGFLRLQGVQRAKTGSVRGPAVAGSEDWKQRAEMERLDIHTSLSSCPSADIRTT